MFETVQTLSFEDRDVLRRAEKLYFVAYTYKIYCMTMSYRRDIARGARLLSPKSLYPDVHRRRGRLGRRAVSRPRNAVQGTHEVEIHNMRLEAATRK